MRINFRLLLGNDCELELDGYPYIDSYYELSMTVEMEFCPQIGWTWFLFPKEGADSETATLAGVRMNHGNDPTLFDLLVEGSSFQELKGKLIEEGWGPAHDYPGW